MTIKALQIFCLICMAVMLTACPKPILKGYSAEADEAEISEEPSEENPRVIAALQLTDQGRRLIADRQPDKAIRILEQAVSLNSTNGQAYYYLSEAWLMKGSTAQAKEFNHLAEIHLKEDSDWMIRVAQQEDRISESEK